MLGDDGGAALARRAMDALREIAGVHSVGIGGRERAGAPTGELVLKVYVDAKRSRDELADESLVPARVEGLPTDVVEAPDPQLAAAVAGAQLGGPYNQDNGRYRPLTGGGQLAGESCYGKGTLGFIARIDEPPPERIVAVTAHHALFSSTQAEQVDLRVGQPTGDDSVTKCCRGIFGKYLKGYRDATMDAAIIRLEPQAEYYEQIEDIGATNSDHDITPAEAATLTFAVRKRGRTTRVTGGTVQSIHTVHASGSPSNYTVIKPNNAAAGTATFADWGDSGAAVVNDANEIVGLLFGMASLTSGQPQVGWGFAWGIKELKDRFNADGIELICPVGTLNVKKVAQVRPGDDAAPQQLGEPAVLARQVEEDLEASELGRSIVALWMQHSHELNQLVTGNKRVAARWMRLGGSALLQSALRAAYSPELTVPEQIEGRSADACLGDILDLFDKYGSPQLRADIRAYRALLPSVAGLTYPEIVAALAKVEAGGERWRD
jgi:hypothetical protein